jgi:hypothetical protein
MVQAVVAVALPLSAADHALHLQLMAAARRPVRLAAQLQPQVLGGRKTHVATPKRTGTGEDLYPSTTIIVPDRTNAKLLLN